MNNNGKLTSYAILENRNDSAGSDGVEAGGLVGDAAGDGVHHEEEIGHR